MFSFRLNLAALAYFLTHFGSRWAPSHGTWKEKALALRGPENEISWLIKVVMDSKRKWEVGEAVKGKQARNSWVLLASVQPDVPISNNSMYSIIRKRLKKQYKPAGTLDLEVQRYNSSCDSNRVSDRKASAIASRFKTNEKLSSDKFHICRD